MSKELSQPKNVAVAKASKSTVVIMQSVLIRAMFIFRSNGKEYKHKVAKEVWFNTNEKSYICEEMFQT